MLFEFNSPINSPFVIVDNEISNDVSDKYDPSTWYYEQADIVCMGVLVGDKIKIFFREKQEDIDLFKKQIKEELDKYETIYAFNRSMEFGNFKGFLGKEYNVEEIKAFKGSGWNKQKFFEVLIADGKIEPSLIPKDPLEKNSEKCISCYAEEDYETIIIHNKADLIKQAILMKNKDYLLKKFEARINKNGWIR